MKPQPVIVNFIPDEGSMEIWVGNECLIIDGFLKGSVVKHPDRTSHTRVFNEYTQKRIIRKFVDNLM